MPVAHFVLEMIAWLAALAGGYAVYRWRLAEELRAVASRLGQGYFLSLMAGSVIGAFAFGTFNLYLSDLAGVGRSILGGLTGAILAVETYKWRRRITGSTGAVFAVPLCISVAIGRIGCYNAGLADFTYGTPTTLPWGADFGDGMLRHPVQIYESLAMTVCLIALLIGFRRGSEFVMRNAFYLTVGWYGLQRFGWEFLKPYGSLAGPFNMFHVLSLVLVVYALIMLRQNVRVPARA